MPASLLMKPSISLGEVAERLGLVLDDLAEEEVLALDRGGALVEGVDLGVADVLLDGVLLQEAGATEGLQRLGAEQHPRTLRAVALHDREQQVVDPHGQLVGLAVVLGDLDAVLPRGGVEHQRAHRLGERLLHHQRATYVGVVGDRHARGRLVRGLGEVGALHAGLGVLERVEVAGRQGGDRLGADHHPGVLDDLEHLRDAVVDLAEEVADGRLAAADAGVAEGELAGVGDLDAHLVLDVGDVGAVALAELTGLDVEVVLRHDEQAQALGAGAADALDAHGARQHHVDDVVAQVALGRGDEALDALDVPGAVVVLGGLGAAGADVGAGVGLGEHHGGVPVLVDDVLGDLLVAVVAVAVAGCPANIGPAPYIHSAGLAPSTSSPSAQLKLEGAGRAAELGHGAEAPVLGVHPGCVALLERLGQRSGVVFGSKTGGLRSASANDSARSSRASRSTSLRIDCAVSASTSANGPSPRTSSRLSTSKRLNSMSRMLLL